MITGKQRSYLKGIANNIKPIAQIGKAGVTDVFIEQLDLALEAREIVKITILDTSLLDAKETASEVVERLNAEFVQAIGNKFVIYRKAKENPKIELSKS